MMDAIAIVGPTASGKSDVADLVAVELGGEVISADAMQVYRGMDIGTAKVPAAERRVHLWLVDVADPAESYSAALYQRDAREAIADIRSRGRIPVVCGGTGLYIRAALDEMDFPEGDSDSEARAAYNELAERLGPKGIHALLAKRDPRSAEAIHPNNVRRVVRALEMLDQGRSYADQVAGFSTPRPRYRALYFGLERDREELYRRIDDRVDEMFARGLVDEVRALMDRGLAGALTSRQAIGYKEVIEALEGSITFDEARELIKRRSRRYAKRQLSWFRRDGRIRWIDVDGAGVDGAAKVICDAWRAVDDA